MLPRSATASRKPIRKRFAASSASHDARGLRQVAAQTIAIDRITPLGSTAAEYLQNLIFSESRCGRVRPYVSKQDHTTFARLCDPSGAEFALQRPDFHFIQTLSVVVGEA